MIDFNLDKLIKAKSVFEEFRQNMKTERDKAGAIQAFEFCYELSWKVMKRALAIEGLEANSPKEVFRLSGRTKFIDDVEKWFYFQQLRNLTAHTYEYENMGKIIESFDAFSQELEQVILNLNKYVTSN